MGLYEWKLTGPEFIHNFTKFNNNFKGKEKIYKKIIYDAWCDLNKHRSDVEARIKYNANLEAIYVYAGKKWCDIAEKYGTVPYNGFTAYTFFEKDCSFGTFLNRELISKEIDKLMTYTCNTYSDLASASASTNTINTAAPSGCVTINGNDIMSTKAYSNYDTYSNWVTSTGTTIGVKEAIKEHETKYHNEKEREKNMKFANFDFGPCTNDNVRMSMYGLAVKNTNGTWVSYDTTKGTIMDVDIFNFDGAKFLYKIPVAIKDVRAGDVVIHMRKPMFVTKVSKGSTSITAVDPVDGELKEIMLTRSPFGFNFVTKVVNLFDGMMNAAATPTEENPFGNVWMLMAMNDGKMEDALPLMMLSQGAQGGQMNPMMMYMMMSDKNSKNDWLPLMFMMNGTMQPPAADK